MPERGETAEPGATPGLDADLLVGGAAPVASELEPGPAPLFDLPALGERFRRWTGILAAFFSAQALAQAAGLAAGLVFVRTLPLEEFAFYTLASSILVTLAFFSDLGSSAAMLHFFHRTRKDGSAFEPWAAAIVSLRRRLFALAAPFAALALAWWGRERGVEPRVLALAAGVVLGAAWFQISGTIRVLRLRLDDRYGESYRAEIAGALVRLGLALALFALGWTFATPALATALVAAAVTALVARGGAVRAEPGRDEMAGNRRAVVRYLLPTLPGAA
ncbi:MAG TPA: hypothetical protein VLA66_00845, partial [Thermoanaerobaculia bacterium]|nr:hypothetical protein [Thermoanaerobaculia bacterium]